MAKFRGKELVKEGAKELITLEETSVESAPDESAPEERSSQEDMFAPTQEEEKEKNEEG